jgi:hypothetical protein
MRRLYIKKSKRWIPVVEFALIAVVWAAGWAANYGFRTHTFVVHDAPARALISNAASLVEVNANLQDPPYANGQLAEVYAQLQGSGGFTCSAWTNGDPATGHGWIVLRCTK